MMRTRGFTLLEILIALGVLAVVLGLSLPAMSSRLERGSFDAALDRVRLATELARERSREIGAPVRLRARSVGDAPVTIEWRPARDPENEREAGMRGVDEPAWIPLTALASGFAVSGERPHAQGEPGADPLAGPVDTPVGVEGDRTRTHAIGVFLPGGEAVVSGPTFLVESPASRPGEGARWGEITISPWTGAVSVERGVTTDTPLEDPDERVEEMSEGLLKDGGVSP